MADIQLIRGSNGNGPAVRPVVTAARSSGSLTIKVNSTTNLPSSFIGTWGKLNQDTGKLISSSIRDFYGTVNGADIDLVRMADGFTDDGNAIGDVIVVKPNTDWTHNLADTLQVSHNPDGTLKDNSVTSAALADNAVNTAKIANGAVTPAQLNAAARGDYSTSEVNTGFKWIDGKTIYKRTYTGTISSPANSRAVTSIMSGVSTLIRYEGELYETVGGTRLLVPSGWVNTTGGNLGAGYLLLDSAGQVNLLSFVTLARTNSPYTVTVYYTKV